MLPTSFEQRLLIKNIDKKYYDEALQKFLNLLENKIENCLCSVILYGSLAKDSVIPGWSDLDVLIVLDCRDMIQFASFNNVIQSCSQTIYDHYNIYLSLDVIRKEEFPSSKSKIPKL